MLKKYLLVVMLLLSSGIVYSAPVTIKEGVDYTVIQKSVTSKRTRPVLVREFFSFTCIHCKDLEPMLEQYMARNRTKVNLEKIHVIWNNDPQMKGFAKLSATLQATKLTRLYTPAFNAIFDQQNLANPQLLASFLQQNKLNKAQIDNFFRIYNSFDIDVTLSKYKELTLAPIYAINGTPTIIVNEQYIINPAVPSRLIEVLDALVNKTVSGR